VYALDTNTLSYFLRGEGEVSRRLRAVNADLLGLPSIVAYELSYGLKRIGAGPRRVAELDLLLAAMVPLAFDAAAAEIASQIRVGLENRGETIGSFDVLIAATAIAHNAVLVTRNRREFERVPLLRVEDWFA
jgi:tRNA(fMet)-specific endonuclease VapC